MLLRLLLTKDQFPSNQYRCFVKLGIRHKSLAQQLPVVDQYQLTESVSLARLKKGWFGKSQSLVTDFPLTYDDLLNKWLKELQSTQRIITRQRTIAYARLTLADILLFERKKFQSVLASTVPRFPTAVP